MSTNVRNRRHFMAQATAAASALAFPMVGGAQPKTKSTQCSLPSPTWWRTRWDATWPRSSPTCR